MIGKPTTLEHILANKERRAQKQKELLAHAPSHFLVSLSINTPSSIKLSHESVVVYEIAHENILTLLRTQGFICKEFHPFIAPTGAETLFTCKGDAKAFKMLTCKLEEEHPLGRLMDIDVVDEEGVLLSRSDFGLKKRRCLVCDAEAFVCARAQKHSYQELNAHIKTLVHKHAFNHSIALWCERAMKTEVELTPKPGLVDSANSGAHRDMDINTFYASIQAIKPYISKFLEAQPLSFDTLRSIGVACEQAMFEATNRVNTHKGMVFCLALTCGALASLKARQQPFTCKDLKTQIQHLCEGLVEKDLLLAHPQSAGARFFYETGSLGIRGIAQSGFALVFEGSLPFFEIQKERLGEEKALKMTLLWLMERLDDSTLWSRGGVHGLSYVKTKANEILLHVMNEPDQLDASLKGFDEDLTAQHLSPGGSADLLALTWLFSHLSKIVL
jgi:holo-ACP synthase/triphosphoribosyl-dephospho-CoA synthase